MHEGFAGKGDKYRIEAAFVDALLNILDGGSLNLREDNPYADVVQQVIEAIADFHRENAQ